MISIAVFGAALAGSVWAMWTTIAPQSARIVDLLVNGPKYAPRAVTVSVRDVRVRRVPATRMSAPVPLRAAA